MKKYKVPSKSNPKITHQVIDTGVIFLCDCIANETGKECRHIKAVKRHLGIKYEPLRGECWYCNTKDFVTEHHLWRRSQDGLNKPTVWLCLKHHDLTTNNKDFEINLQKLYEQKNSGKLIRLGTN
jgi:hypothetical protein